eukprot:3928817-Prymnesium_polylepis.3
MSFFCPLSNQKEKPSRPWTRGAGARWSVQMFVHTNRYSTSITPERVLFFFTRDTKVTDQHTTHGTSRVHPLR